MARVVFFDVGGVLEDRGGLDAQIVSVTSDALSENGLVCSDELIVRHRKRLEQLLGDKPFENRYFYWRDLIELAGGATATTAQLRRVYSSYLRRYRELVDLHSDVVPCFDSLRDSGVSLAVLANSTMEKAELFLDKFGLAPRLVDCFVSELVGSNKPLPLIFRYALWKLDIDPSVAIHVGDRHDNDVIGAGAAGLATVLVRRPGSGDRPGQEAVERADRCHVIESLLELPRICSSSSMEWR